MNIASWVHLLLGLVLAPLLLGVINRVKAKVGGRQGQPLLQVYFDLNRLLRKGAVYSHTTTWVFVVGPTVGLACVLAALAMTPLGAAPAVVGFSGDVVLFGAVLALARMVTVLAALDTGSAFEGMGASREVQFSALAEPALLLSLVVASRLTESLSLSVILPNLAASTWVQAGPALVLVAVALFLVLLAENARIPVDDPTTHLELTMIHEVMVLDHSGPDFAFIQYGAAVKLWVFSLVLVGLVVPVNTGNHLIDTPAALAGVFACAILVGMVESAMARVRLIRVPRLLVGALALSALGALLVR